MEFDAKTEEYVLSSGRRFYAFDGSLGLGSKYDPTELTYGSDGEVGFAYDPTKAEWADHSWFTQEERDEIAAHMIALWTAWKARRFRFEGSLF